MSLDPSAGSHFDIDQFIAQLYDTQPTLPSVYGSHQRSNSNPRAYAAPDLNAAGAADARRDDSAQGVYNPEGAYAGFQQGGNYPGVGGVGYGGYQGMSLAGYSTQTPASASRRTSGPKPASTPPASAPAGAATNPSPGSRYYPTPAQGTPDQVTSSPYQPSSAPPQASHHQSQPQTAHPYGGGYYNYYDQQQGQWQQHYNHGFAQPRPPVSNSASGSERTPQTGSAGFDYSQYPGYAGHDRTAAGQHSQQWQTPTSARSGSVATQGTPTQAWPGYPNHHQLPPQQMAPHHMAQGQMMPGQYAWQQQQWNAAGYGYPPVTPHSAQPIPQPPHAPGVSPSSLKKEKKVKEEYKGLGKRPAESGTEEEGDDKKELAGKGKKKGKKVEEEKPIPKPPAKSHLHPPRQAQSAWQLFFTDELNKAKEAAAQGNSPGGTPHHAKLNVAQIAKDAGIAYANLNSEQKKYYAGKVQESKDQYAKELAVWQATLTPEDIRAENAFRAQQRKEGKSRKGNLKDPNAPKKPLSAYFLFLKGIREDDALRARVWGEESETTKQSVLAAERWRSLSDEEKKPFLAQAEKDKQEYEAARKIYEDEAAARARGEDIPLRLQDPDPYHHVPKPVIHELSGNTPSDLAVAGIEQVLEHIEPKSEAMFGDFTHDSGSDEHHSDPVADPSTGIDEFHGFADPLDGMDLGGFQDVSERNGEQEGEWGELNQLMGGDVPEEKKPESEEDVSEAPKLEEGNESTEQDLPTEEVNVQEVALAAEGGIVVPTIDFKTETAEPAEQVPTEEVSEMPLVDVMPVAGDSLNDDIDESIDDASAPVDPVIAPISEAVDDVLHPDLLEPVAPVEQEPETDITTTSEAQPAFDSAALSGDILPELITEDVQVDAPPLPEGTTVEPATDATKEDVPAEEPESEPPAVDGI